jgi:hypothetical protein
MLYIIILVSIALGSIGIYLLYSANRQHSNIPKTAELVPISKVLKIALLYGISSFLLSYSIVTIWITISDNKTSWSFNELRILGVFSATIAVVFFLSTIYQISWTVKYRDNLINKYKGKK